MPKLNFLLLSPTETFFEGPAAAVTLPAVKGRLEILPHHAETLGELKKGVLSWTAPNGHPKQKPITHGFFRLNDNQLTVLI